MRGGETLDLAEKIVESSEVLGNALIAEVDLVSSPVRKLPTYRALCVRDGVKRQKGMKVLVGAWT